ncbi:hypothetical protein LCGC14_2523620 [marine sediment metagenome]|uniref:Uncharacterized protein n=1 Tax=marine sediment metagenome TaxID=412755 RepID=A0A0F9D785_9ZZZZ
MPLYRVRVKCIPDRYSDGVRSTMFKFKVYATNDLIAMQLGQIRASELGYQVVHFDSVEEI